MRINGIKINGIEASEAKLNGDIVYQKEKIIEFTSRPYPSNWSVVTTGKEYIANNEHGTWKIWADNYSNNPISYAFDSDYDTRWFSGKNNSDSVAFNMGIDLPEGVTICPKKITVRSYLHKNSSKVLGFNAETGVWDTLFTLNNTTNENNNGDRTLNTDKFYSKFKMQLYRYSSLFNSTAVRMFEITTGTLKKQ